MSNHSFSIDMGELMRLISEWLPKFAKALLIFFIALFIASAVWSGYLYLTDKEYHEDVDRLINNTCWMEC